MQSLERVTTPEVFDATCRALDLANVDANNFRDALKQILRLCDENRRGVVSEIEVCAMRALGEL